MLSPILLAHAQKSRRAIRLIRISMLSEKNADSFFQHLEYEKGKTMLSIVTSFCMKVEFSYCI